MILMRELKTALKNLTTSTLRTVLAIIGILVGTASVVALVSIGQMATNEALAQFKSLGTNLLSISLSDKDPSKKINKPFSLEDALKIQNLTPDIQNVAPYTNLFLPILYKDERISGIVIGANYALADIIHLHLLSGRFVSQFDHYEKYCVLGYDIFQKLNQAAETLLDQRITIGGSRYVIIGVLDQWPENAFFNQNINGSIIIPILGSLTLNSYTAINSIIIRLNPDAKIPMLKDKIENYFNTVAPEKQIFFRSAEELLKKMQTQHNIFTLLLGLIGSISLLVGGIGVMNIMLFSILERRQEIGIRLAMGAYRSEIQWMFLTESVLLSVLGGLSGVIVGILLSFIVAAFSDWQFQLFLWPPLIGFSVSLLIGIFFGVYPAYKASQLNPIDTLRSE